MKEKSNIKFAFFGTDEFSVTVLESLKKSGIIPSLIITSIDKPKGRKLILTPPQVKIWAEENKVNFLQPNKLDPSVKDTLTSLNFDFFLVASYGKIIPESFLDIPKHKTFNIHPSLLPKLRGSSPIQETILQQLNPGVTIIKLDKEVDHGPILAQKELEVDIRTIKASILLPKLAELGAELFIKTLPDLLNKKLKETPQDDSLATFTKKIQKEDALINLGDDPFYNYKKILAYDIWPRAFFLKEIKGKQTRVIITSAKFEDGKLLIEKVIPENKKETLYTGFINSLNL